MKKILWTIVLVAVGLALLQNADAGIRVYKVTVVKKDTVQRAKPIRENWYVLFDDVEPSLSRAFQLMPDKTIRAYSDGDRYLPFSIECTSFGRLSPVSGKGKDSEVIVSGFEDGSLKIIRGLKGSVSPRGIFYWNDQHQKIFVEGARSFNGSGGAIDNSSLGIYYFADKWRLDMITEYVYTLDINYAQDVFVNIMNDNGRPVTFEH